MEQLQGHAAEHRELLTELGQLDYAHSALIQAESRIETLNDDLKQHQKALQDITKQTQKEYDDWQKVEHSRLRRAALLVKGRDNLEARVEKEEREWLEALKEEARMKDKITTTQREIDEMREMVVDLKALSARHTAAQKRLDSIYEHVFAGPSEQFPEEDNAETEVYALEKEYKDTQSQTNGTAQAISLLAKADASMIQAIRELNQVSFSLDGPLFFRSSYADVMERNHIEKAATYASRVSAFYNEARSYDRELPASLELPNLIALANSYFDDRFWTSTIDTVDKLTKSVNEAQRAIKRSSTLLREEIKKGQNRVKTLQSKSQSVHLRLRRARAFLDSTRRAIMVDVQMGIAGQQLVEEPESIDDSSSTNNEPSNNPYAAFLVSRAATLDAPQEEAPPAYVPRTRDFQ